MNAVPPVRTSERGIKTKFMSHESAEILAANAFPINFLLSIETIDKIG